MKKNLSVLAVAALALAGCVPAQAEANRVVSTAAVAHYAIGNTANSITEVREALNREDMRAEVHDNVEELLSSSEAFETTFEFERDLFVCEQLHPIPADHEPDHPESTPLANCVRSTIEALAEIGPILDQIDSMAEEKPPAGATAEGNETKTNGRQGSDFNV